MKKHFFKIYFASGSNRETSKSQFNLARRPSRAKKEATNWRLAFKLLSTKPSLAFLFLPLLFSVACNLFLPVCFCHLPLCLDLPLPACPFVYQQPIWVLFSSLPMTLVPSNIGWLCLCLSVYNLSLLGSLFHSIN